MIDLAPIDPHIVNDKTARLADEDDLATICNLCRAPRVLPDLGYRGIGIGFEGAMDLYLRHASSVNNNEN